jgi:hypothetical protein
VNRDDYSDMLDLPHHVSTRHPQMSIHDRAAQFSPFAALVGHDAAMRETARYTQDAPDLAQDELSSLDEELGLLLASGVRDVTVTYFEPDAKKDGGSFKTVSGRIRRVDDYARALVFESGLSVPLASVVSIGASS